MARDRWDLRSSRHKNKVIPRAVRIVGILNTQTKFTDYRVIESDVPSKENPYPSPRDERDFRIVPSPSDRHLVVQCADIGHSGIAPLELAAQVIAVYHTPRAAKRRLLSEARTYAGRLMTRWGSPLLTPE